MINTSAKFGCGRTRFMSVLAAFSLATLALPAWTAEIDIFAAARDGDLNRIAELIDAGVEVNQTAYGSTPLDVAVKHERLEIVELLQSSGAQRANELSLKGKDLFEAVNTIDVKRVKVLLRGGADANQLAYGRTPLLLAHVKSNETLKETLQEYGAKYPPPRKKTLYEAARDGEIDRLSELIDAGEDVNQPWGSFSPLASAASNGQEAAVEILIKHGADVNVRDEFGRTLLHHSVHSEKENAYITEKLLEGGVDIDARDNYGNTALLFATRNPSPEGFMLLLEHGADVNIAAHSRDTPLLAAILNGRPERVRMLLARGADVNVRNFRGETPLIMAVSGPLPPDASHVRMLLEGGADPNIQDDRGRAAIEIMESNLNLFLEIEERRMSSSKRRDSGATAMEEVEQIKSEYYDVLEMLKQAAVAESK